MTKGARARSSLARCCFQGSHGWALPSQRLQPHSFLVIPVMFLLRILLAMQAPFQPTWVGISMTCVAGLPREMVAAI